MLHRLLLVFTVFLPACGGSTASPGEEARAQNVREFVVDLIENHTSDITDPVPVNDMEFDLDVEVPPLIRDQCPNRNEDFRNDGDDVP